MTFPLTTLAATVSAAGITAPPYVDVLASLQASFRLIYGADAYLEADSQDGQLLAVFALAVHDCNQAAIAAYNNWSPNTAQGTGLSNAVKVNGITRRVPSFSQANLTVSGVAGTVIGNGKAADAAGNRWLLPASVVIPPAAVITVTATAEVTGAVTAPIGTVTVIATPIAGWQGVTNPTAAIVGAPVESDADLRARQAASTGLAALTVLEAISAAVAAVPGVTELKVYENDTNVTDANTLPPHSIAVVVIGGAVADITTAIMRKKTPGAYTHGTTLGDVTDSSGVTYQIRYFVPAQRSIAVNLTVRALTGYTAATGQAVKDELARYVSALPIGQAVFITRLYLPAQLNGAAPSSQFELQALTAGYFGGTLGTTDVAIAFNEVASLVAANVTLTVV
jgi:uncharacterized phage protein gp47/JayE